MCHGEWRFSNANYVGALVRPTSALRLGSKLPREVSARGVWFEISACFRGGISRVIICRHDVSAHCIHCACLFKMTKPGEGPFNYTSLHSRFSVLWIITFHETFKWIWVVLSMKKSVITVHLCSVLYLLSFMGATYAQPCHFDWKLQTDDIDRNNWWVAFIIRFTKCLVAAEDGALGLETTPKLLSATCTYIGRTWHLGKTFRK